MAISRETNIEIQQRINHVLVHIQNHLETPPSLNELAHVAAFSPYHFHRIFTAYVGESTASYVRRIRLEEAARQLLHSKQAVLEIALNVGYESQSTFGKVFKKHFGVTPAAYRNAKGTYTATAAITHKQIRSASRPTIVKLASHRVLFVRKTGTYSLAAKEAWRGLMSYAYSQRLMHKDTKTIGISHDSPDITNEHQLRYDACITALDGIVPTGEVGVQTLAAGTYACFMHQGAYENFGQTYGEIFKEWLPNSRKVLRHAPCFELYLNRDPRRTKPENLRTEIYVPIEE